MQFLNELVTKILKMKKNCDAIFPPKKLKFEKQINIQFFNIYAKFQVPSIKTKKMDEGEHFRGTVPTVYIHVFNEL